MSPSRRNAARNGRGGRAARDLDDGVPSLRHRSPLAYWVAVIVLAGLLATVIGSFIASVAR